MSAARRRVRPRPVFKEGGFAPNKLLGGAEGEKIKPLKGLEESLKAGKALLRGNASAETTPASLNLGLGQPIARRRRRCPAPAPSATDNVVQFPRRHRRPRRVHAHRGAAGPRRER